MKDWKKEMELREVRQFFILGLTFLCIAIAGAACIALAMANDSILLAIAGLVGLFAGVVGLVGIVETNEEGDGV